MFDTTRPGRTYAREPATGFAYSLYPQPGGAASLFEVPNGGARAARDRYAQAAFAPPPPIIPLDPTDPGTWVVGNPPNDRPFGFRRLAVPAR